MARNLDMFPDELLLKIIAKVPFEPKSYLNIGLTNRHLNQLFQSQSLPRMVVMEQYRPYRLLGHPSASGNGLTWHDVKQLWKNYDDWHGWARVLQGKADERVCITAAALFDTITCLSWTLQPYRTFLPYQESSMLARLNMVQVLRTALYPEALLLLRWLLDIYHAWLCSDHALNPVGSILRDVAPPLLAWTQIYLYHNEFDLFELAERCHAVNFSDNRIIIENAFKEKMRGARATCERVRASVQGVPIPDSVETFVRSTFVLDQVIKQTPDIEEKVLRERPIDDGAIKASPKYSQIANLNQHLAVVPPVFKKMAVELESSEAVNDYLRTLFADGERADALLSKIDLKQIGTDVATVFRENNIKTADEVVQALKDELRALNFDEIGLRK